MKRIAVLVVLLLPAFGLAFFALQPQADLTVSVPIFHFYIVTFTTFSAAVISILLVASLGLQAPPRHLLAAAAFAVIGSVFFSHGLATPGALINHSHPAVEWSAWITLFGGGLLFAVAGLDGPHGSPAWLPVRRVIQFAIGGVLLYSAVAALAPGWLTFFDQRVVPWHKFSIFFITLALWLFAAFRLWKIWRWTHDSLDGVLAGVAFWLATATVSMHEFPIWKLSWWLYHVVLLVGFLITAYFLVGRYEQIRHFRLARYYLALSLILTALLALAASALFTQFAYTTLVSEAETAASNISHNLANSLASDLFPMASADDLPGLASQTGVRNLVRLRMTGLPLNRLVIYDQPGLAVYASEPELVGVKVDNPAAFASALSGQTVVIIHPPDDAPASYHPSARVHVIETFVPLRPGGKPDLPAIGVVATVQEAPSLNQAQLNARLAGLVTAAITMGLLFIALLTVVGRADQIIVAQTEDLRKISARLKTYSEWLLGRNLLGQVLANPDALGLTRRERTILFIDIRSFTRWSEVRSPEEVVALLNHYYNVIEASVTRHQVIKFKFSADEALAVFATADQGVAAAQELRDRIRPVLAKEGLQAGLGLHTGPVVEGLLGSTEVKFYDVIGDTVNTAKRIESASTNFEVLISDATQQALGQAIPVGAAQPIAAKGKEAPVTVYPVRQT